MQGWIERDSHGGEMLVRHGQGVVTAVVPLSDTGDLFRVEIECERPPGRPRALRLRVHPVASEGSEVLAAARLSMVDQAPVSWTVHWTRHDWIPSELPIGSLDLATDTTAVLTDVTIAVPDFLVEEWTSARGSTPTSESQD